MEIADPRIDPALVPAGSRAIVIAEHQQADGYLPRPSVRTPDHQVITRWVFTDEERRRVFEGEDLFITIFSAGAISPLFATVGPVNWRLRGTETP
jgi:hypothetical protein